MANQIKQLQHNFLWDKPKFHLADRVKLCAPLPSGGLAIRSLRHSNEVLLGKWLWRFGFERDALWRRLIEVKNGCEIWGEGGLMFQLSVWFFKGEFLEVYQTGFLEVS